MNQIRIVAIDYERTDSNALYHCDACAGAFPSPWPRWRIEAGYNHGGNTRTMRLCNLHRAELADVLFYQIFLAPDVPRGRHEEHGFIT